MGAIVHMPMYVTRKTIKCFRNKAEIKMISDKQNHQLIIAPTQKKCSEDLKFGRTLCGSHTEQCRDSQSFLSQASHHAAAGRLTACLFYCAVHTPSGDFEISVILSFHIFER